jgi:Dual-action HEIGH metallo-peptidase
MRKILLCLSAVVITATFSCSKNDASAPKSNIPEEDLTKIQAMGFGTNDIVTKDDGYIVEGDIFLSKQDLNQTITSPVLRIAEVEQYRTFNLVSSLPRTITISLSGLTTAFVSGTDLAISRYNALNLRIKFSRVSSGGQIRISGFNQPPSGGFITLGSAGFPSGGNPFGSITMNTNSAAFGTNPNVNYIGSVIQHEIGHCIGMRHTDYFNRSLSCGVGGNEGQATTGIGAVLIPGTPSGFSSGSWMLACSGGGNRTFNSNDVIALNYLYK